MPQPRPSRFFWVSLLIGAILIVLVSLQRSFESQENILYDLCLRLRPLQKISSDIAIVEIDDETLHQLGQWPLPRDFHASLLDILKEFGAKAVIFDLIFSESTDHDPVFAESIKNAGQVYLPEVFDVPGKLNSRKLLERPHSLLAPLTEVLANNVAAKGHINVIVDPDGKFRRVPLFVKDEQGLAPQLGLQAVCGFLNLNCSHLRFSHDEVMIDDRLRIPVDDFNTLLVNYPGRWKESFEHFSYLEILAAYKEWRTHQGDPGRLSQLKGKVCFVGLTAAGTVDLKASPLENNYPMLGVHASIFNSVLEERFLRRASPVVNIILVLLIYFLCVWIGVNCKPLVSFLGSGLLTILYAAVSGSSLIVWGIWIDLFLPLVVIVSVYLICVSLRWSREMRQREMLEKEMLIAQKIQLQFLRGPNEESRDGDVALWFQPAKYVAGDFYDVFPLDGKKTGIVVGDVSGKGLPAALCMAQTISLFRIFSRQPSSPEETLGRLNQELCLRGTDRFVTALYCVVDADQKSVQVTSAGHGPLFIYRDRERTMEEISLPPRAPLGVMNDTVYESKALNIHPKDKLIVFSDGVIEARDGQGKELGIEKIKESILANASCPNKEILEHLTAMVVKYMGASVQHDDVTMIIFSIKS